MKYIILILLFTSTAFANGYSEEKVSNSVKIHSEARLKMYLAYTANTEAIRRAAKDNNRALLNDLRRERASYSECDQLILESELQFNSSVPDCVNDIYHFNN